MERKLYAENKKEILVVMMKDKEELKILNDKTKAKHNILQFLLERLQTHYLWLEKCLISWWKFGQGLYNDYIIFKDV